MKYTNPPGSPSFVVSIKECLRHFWHIWCDKEDVVNATKEIIMPHDKIISGMNALQNEDGLTWLGHACVLISINKINILCDPLLTRKVYPVPFYTNKNMIHPVIKIDDLPKINIILITHNHFDHFNLPTLKKISNKDDIIVIVPKDTAKYLKGSGFYKIYELAWHEKITIENILFEAIPAIHKSWRRLFDKDQTLWTSYLIMTPTIKIFFSCDTAYGGIYQALGEKIAPIDLAILSIGAYGPTSYNYAIHATPEDALKIGLDFKATAVMGMHWGTLKITEEPIMEPGKLFIKAAKNHFSSENIWLLKIGETRLFQALKKNTSSY